MVAMSASQIIEALGGDEGLSAITGVPARTIWHWHRIGIPARLWPLVVQAAQVRGVEGVTFEALGAPMEEGTGAARRPRRKKGQDAARSDITAEAA